MLGVAAAAAAAAVKTAATTLTSQGFLETREEGWQGGVESLFFLLQLTCPNHGSGRYEEGVWLGVVDVAAVAAVFEPVEGGEGRRGGRVSQCAQGVYLSRQCAGTKNQRRQEGGLAKGLARSFLFGP